MASQRRAADNNLPVVKRVMEIRDSVWNGKISIVARAPSNFHNLNARTPAVGDDAENQVGNCKCRRIDAFIVGAEHHDGKFRLPDQVLSSCFNELQKYLDLAASQESIEPECVHQLRVWSRRTIAGLRFFAPLLPRSQNRNLQTQIKRVRSAAGTARDCDVMLERLRREENRQNKKKQRLDNTSQRELKSYLNSLVAERESAQLHLYKLVRQIRKKQKLNAKFQKLANCLTCETAQWTPDFFRQWAHCRLLHVTDNFGHSAMERPSDLNSLHQFRLQIKKIRYTLELVIELANPCSVLRILRQFSQLQERLGNVNDLVVLLERLEKGHVKRSSSQVIRREPNKIQILKVKQKQLKSELKKLHAFLKPAKLQQIKRALDHLLVDPKNGK